MRQLDRPDLRGFVPRQKPSEFRLVLKLTRPENHSLERRKAFLPGGWIFLSTRGRILISANGVYEGYTRGIRGVYEGYSMGYRINRLSRSLERRKG